MSLEQAYANVKNRKASIQDVISVICGRFKNNITIKSAYELSNYGLNRLIANGFTENEAKKIRAAFALIELAKHDDEKPETIRTMEDAVKWLKPIAFLNQEHVMIIALDEINKVIGTKIVSIGTINRADAEPRDILQFAIENHAHSILLAHVHPSHNCYPSSSDLEITDKIAESAKLINVELIDHIIIGGPNYISFKQHGLL